MPIIVNKEAIKEDIIRAFQRLAAQKPLPSISLREIAAEAGMSHSKILRYFSDKNSLLVACVHWAGGLLFDHVREWFATHHLNMFSDRKTYLDAFFLYCQTGHFDGVSPRDVVMTCALGAYSDEIRSAVAEEFTRLNDLFCNCLTAEFSKELSQEDVNTISIVFHGIFFTRFNGILSEDSLCHPADVILSLLNK